MKKTFTVIITMVILILLVSVLSGCNRVGSSMNGSGKIIDQEIKIADFDSLHIEGPFTLEITQSDTFKTVISIDDNLIGRVLVSREHNTLTLNIEAPATFFPTQLKVNIAIPEINSITLAQGAQAKLSGFDYIDNLYLFLSDESNFEGTLDTGLTKLSSDSSSQARLIGTASSLELDGRKSSKLYLEVFEVKNAHVRLREASEATLNVNGNLDVNLSEESKVYYLGNPIFSNTSISGGSTMIHK